MNLAQRKGATVNRFSRFILAAGVLAIVVGTGGAIGGCGGNRIQKESERLWGAERVCLPCHAYRLPIARNHNYRCDTCHGGQPYAKDKEMAHRELFPHPQDDAVIQYTCQKCHNERLGYDIPYDSEFVRDVLISHGDYVE